MLVYIILAFVVSVSVWRVIKLRDQQRDAQHRLSRRVRLRRMGRHSRGEENPQSRDEEAP